MNILQQSAFGIDLNLEPAWCNWFSGWVDGEGGFISHIHNNDRGIGVMLTVQVRDDDSRLVYGVRDTLQCGSIWHETHRKSSVHNRNSMNVIQWRCSNTSASRHILIPLFEKYPLHSKKGRDYKIWRELVIAISDGHHLNGNRDYVLDLCQQLKDIRKYVPPNLVDAVR